MCGIFGFVAKKNTIDLRVLERIARQTETRGRHAFGFAWVDQRGRLKMFKSQGRITDHLSLLRMAEGARMLIGHCRFATHGKPSNNLNNHPHPVDGGWLVHNGVIGAYREIIRENHLRPVTHCDSEVLGLLVERAADGSLFDRVCEAAETCADRDLAMAALWRDPRELILVRAGNPVHVADVSGGYWFASLKKGLPDGAYMLRNNTAVSFTHDNEGKATLRAVELSPQTQGV